MTATPAKVTRLRPVTAEPVYLSPDEVCALIPGMTVTNLKELRSSGKGPAFYKPTGDRGHLTIYKRDDVVAWVEASRTTTREQP
ncbi:MAG: hypothetical protein CMH34_05365 [Microbacterium sp.]|nr:hypothetical protein [Microbacterium sp.]